jgi:hypothetical protein
MSQVNVEIVRSLQPSGVDLVEVFEDERFEQVAAFTDPRGLFDESFECSFFAGNLPAGPRCHSAEPRAC